ncbi:MAG: alanyl-tRNA editing protein AlaXM [Candidatus Woesearchaeota archaeon]
MTELMYLKDCYLREFEARVTFIQGRIIELDRTAFYPESGGQPSDRGFLEFNGKTAEVVNVRKEGGRVLHELAADAEVLGITLGGAVKCIVDWNRRYLFMRYHTACHVLSAVICRNEQDVEITGNQIGEEKTRMDFSLKSFDREKLAKYEEEANAEIQKALPVRIEFLEREEAFKIPGLVKLRKLLPESLKVIRIVSIDGLDQQACGGTHVKNTSEIGKIKIIGSENKGKDNRRIYFTLS